MQISTPPSGPTNVQTRVPTIQKQLQNRPTRQELEDQRIVKGNVSQLRDQLHRAQVKDSLKNGLAKRRSIREVFQTGAFESREKGKSGEQYKEYKGLALSEFLKTRPTIQHLVDQRLMEDTLTWSSFPQQGIVPDKRNCHCSCVAGNHLYVFGGYGIQNDAFLNTRMLNLESNTWSIPSCAVAGVFPRNRYSSTCVCLGQRIIIFGGFSPEGYWLNDLHVLDTQSEDQRYTHMWYQPETSGNPPCPRAAHSCTVVGRKLFIFGGNDGANLFDDLYILDTETFHWTRVNSRGVPPAARSGHSALFVKDKIVVFGGGGAGGKPMADVHYLDTRKVSWSQPVLMGTGPSPRAGHTAVVLHKTNVLIFGGGYIDKVYNDVHMLNVERGQWSRPADTGDVPCARTGHSMNAIKSRIFVFGGCDSSGVMYNDLYLLDATFFRTQMVNAFSPKVNSPHFSATDAPIDVKTVADVSDISVEEQTFFTTMLDSTGAHVVTLLDKVEDQIKDRQAEMKLNQQRMIAQVRMYHQTYEDAFKELRTEVEDVKNLILTELSHLRASLRGFLSASSPRRMRAFDDVNVAPPPVGLQKRRSQQPMRPGVHPMMEQQIQSRTRNSHEEVKEEGEPEALDVNISKGDSFLKVPPADNFMSRPPTTDSTEDLEGAFFCDDAFTADPMSNTDTDDTSSVSSASDISDVSAGSPAKEKYKASTALADLIARDMKEGDLDPPKKRRRRRRKKKKKATSRNRSPQGANGYAPHPSQMPSHV